jgi:hypothetical protein
MGEVAGADYGDPFATGPGGEMLKIEVAAGGAGIFGMDVQVRVEAHAMPRQRGSGESPQRRCHDRR